MIFFSLIAQQCVIFIFPMAEQIHPLTSSVSKAVEAEVWNPAISCPAGFVSAAVAVKPVPYLWESIPGYCLERVWSLEEDNSGSTIRMQLLKLCSLYSFCPLPLFFFFFFWFWTAFTWRPGEKEKKKKKPHQCKVGPLFEMPGKKISFHVFAGGREPEPSVRMSSHKSNVYHVLGMRWARDGTE